MAKMKSGVHPNTPQNSGERHRKIAEAGFGPVLEELKKMDLTDIEKQAYKDAYGIAIIGASNPSGVAKTIYDTICALRKIPAYDGTKASGQHPAVRAMVGHLDFLCGNGFGPPIEVIEQIEAMADEAGVPKEWRPK